MRHLQHPGHEPFMSRQHIRMSQQFRLKSAVSPLFVWFEVIMMTSFFHLDYLFVSVQGHLNHSFIIVQT